MSEDNDDKTKKERERQARQDPEVKLPLCSNCNKDPFLCKCGKFEDLNK